MDYQLISAAVEIVASDVQRSLGFYRLLGLTIPEAESPHVEVELPGGNRLLFDTEQAIASFDSGRTSPTSPGRVVLAFGLSAPADVDAVFARVTDAGHPAVVKPFDAPWGQRNATEADPDGTSVDLYGLGSLLLQSRIGEEGQRKLASRIGLEAPMYVAQKGRSE